ncbi:transposable element Tc1 transposase [Caerostris darwini]|uniref:Transposable element Tc1 transposase n=1 Tax=Caerostris darwini TaxID=1538125 RepID=A0AAV4VDS1_9ARAC|nr:transposable element Tc1 transposase [Caerostris darwini]
MAGSGSGVCLETVSCLTALYQQSSSAEVELWSGGVSPGTDWDPWSPFMDDNASCHVSTLTKAWYGANGVHRMDWPAQSPDLNPIENLWDALHRRIQGCTTRPKSLKELLCLLQAEWKKIPLAVIQRLVESMPRMVHSVIASRGGSTNY